jgi:hypothetical protein
MVWEHKHCIGCYKAQTDIHYGLMTKGTKQKYLSLHLSSSVLNQKGFCEEDFASLHSCYLQLRHLLLEKLAALIGPVSLLWGVSGLHHTGAQSILCLLHPSHLLLHREILRQNELLLMTMRKLFKQ